MLEALCVKVMNVLYLFIFLCFEGFHNAKNEKTRWLFFLFLLYINGLINFEAKPPRQSTSSLDRQPGICCFFSGSADMCKVPHFCVFIFFLLCLPFSFTFFSQSHTCHWPTPPFLEVREECKREGKTKTKEDKQTKKLGTLHISAEPEKKEHRFLAVCLKRRCSDEGALPRN